MTKGQFRIVSVKTYGSYDEELFVVVVEHRPNPQCVWETATLRLGKPRDELEAVMWAQRAFTTGAPPPAHPNCYRVGMGYTQVFDD